MLPHIFQEVISLSDSADLPTYVYIRKYKLVIKSARITTDAEMLTYGFSSPLSSVPRVAFRKADEGMQLVDFGQWLVRLMVAGPLFPINHRHAVLYADCSQIDRVGFCPATHWQDRTKVCGEQSR